METFKYLGVVFTSDESRNKGVDTRIGKANTVLHEFIVPWWRNGSFQRKQNIQFLNRSLFRSSPVVMNLRWRLKKYCQKNKRQRWDICEEFSMWHFVTKSTGLKSVKPRMSSPSPNREIPTILDRPRVQNAPGKNGELSHLGYGLHPLESGPKFVQGPGGVAMSPNFLGTVLMWA